MCEAKNTAEKMSMFVKKISEQNIKFFLCMLDTQKKFLLMPT